MVWLLFFITVHIPDYLKLMPEPITSRLTIPFAVFGPDIWTASWLLMIPVSYTLKRIRTRMEEKK